MSTTNRFLLLFLSLYSFTGLTFAADNQRHGQHQSQLPAWNEALKDRAQAVFGRPTMAAMLKNIAWFGGPLALMIYANNKIKKHHKARDIQLREQQGLAAQQQQMMAQLMMALQQGQGGPGGMQMPGGPMDGPDMREPMADDDQFSAEVRQPVMPAGDDGEHSPNGPQAHGDGAANEDDAAATRAPEDMMPMGMPALPQMPQVKQPSYNVKDILSKKAYWFWQVTSWFCGVMVLYHGTGLAFNSFALARSVIKGDEMPHKPGALSKVEKAVEEHLNDFHHRNWDENPNVAAAEIAAWRAQRKMNGRQEDGVQRGGRNTRDILEDKTVADLNHRAQDARQQAVDYFEQSPLAITEQSICGHNTFARFKLFMTGIQEGGAA